MEDIRISPSDFPPSLSRRRYNVDFFRSTTIHTTVTDAPSRVSEWIDDVMSRHNENPGEMLTIDLGVKWCSSSIADGSSIAILPLCVGNLCLLYQIRNSAGVPERLANFLSGNDRVTFVGIGDKRTWLGSLEDDYGIGAGAVYVDLVEFAAEKYNRVELKNAGLRGLGRELLGRDVNVPFSVALGRWEDRQLTAEQVKYAYVAAYMSYEMGKNLGAAV